MLEIICEMNILPMNISPKRLLEPNSPRINSVILYLPYLYPQSLNNPLYDSCSCIIGIFYRYISFSDSSLTLPKHSFFAIAHFHKVCCSNYQFSDKSKISIDTILPLVLFIPSYCRLACILQNVPAYYKARYTTFPYCCNQIDIVVI